MLVKGFSVYTEMAMEISQPQYKLNVKPPNILSLIILSAFASMGAVIVTPALPTMATFFGITVGQAQLTVTSFLLGYAFGQLLYGPIANRLGRKPAFYIGIALATLGTIFSIISSPFESYTLMIVGRCLEALGSSVGLVVCMTIVNDFYYPEQARKIMAFIMLAFAIVPGCAVLIGSLLTQYLHWQACYYFLLIYGLVLIIPAMTLPETIIQYDYKALHGRYLVSHYFQVVKLRKLVAFALVMGFSTAAVYVFATEGPYIGIDILNINTSIYGFLALIPYAGAMTGAIFSINTTGRFSAGLMIAVGFVCELLAALTMFLLFLFHLVDVWSLLAPMLLFLLGHAFLVTNASVLAVNQTEDKANGSAVSTFLAMLMAVLMTLLLGLVHTSSVMILPIILFVALLFLVLACLLGW